MKVIGPTLPLPLIQSSVSPGPVGAGALSAQVLPADAFAQSTPAALQSPGLGAGLWRPAAGVHDIVRAGQEQVIIDRVLQLETAQSEHLKCVAAEVRDEKRPMIDLADAIQSYQVQRFVEQYEKYGVSMRRISMGDMQQRGLVQQEFLDAVRAYAGSTSGDALNEVMEITVPRGRRFDITDELRTDVKIEKISLYYISNTVWIPLFSRRNDALKTKMVSVSADDERISFFLPSLGFTEAMLAMSFPQAFRKFVFFSHEFDEGIVPALLKQGYHPVGLPMEDHVPYAELVDKDPIAAWVFTQHDIYHAYDKCIAIPGLVEFGQDCSMALHRLAPQWGKKGFYSWMMASMIDVEATSQTYPNAQQADSAPYIGFYMRALSFAHVYFLLPGERLFSPYNPPSIGTFLTPVEDYVLGSDSVDISQCDVEERARRRLGRHYLLNSKPADVGMAARIFEMITSEGEDAVYPHYSHHNCLHSGETIRLREYLAFVADFIRALEEIPATSRYIPKAIAYTRELERALREELAERDGAPATATPHLMRKRFLNYHSVLWELPFSWD